MYICCALVGAIKDSAISIVCCCLISFATICPFWIRLYLKTKRGLTLKTHTFRLRKIPMPYMKYCLTPRKSAFRVILSRRRIVGPFFKSTVDGAVCRDTVQQFVSLLEMDGLDFWFHEDGATCHTANETVQPATLLMRP